MAAAGSGQVPLKVGVPLALLGFTLVILLGVVFVTITVRRIKAAATTTTRGAADDAIY